MRPKVPVICVPGGTTPVDLDGVLYRTTHYQHFQDALRRIDEGLHLAFDRVLARWVIYRDGWEVRRLDGEELVGGELGYQQYVPSVVHDLVWTVDKKHRGGWKRFRYLREPDQATLAFLGSAIRAERARYEWNNNEWMEKRHSQVSDEMEARSDKRAKEHAESVVSDFSTRLDPNASTLTVKPMVSVPRSVE